MDGNTTAYGAKVNISCRISGVFPLPVTKLTWGVFELFEDGVLVNHLGEDSYGYEVIIHKVLEHEELPAETVFGCEVTLPGTEYYVREEAMYHHRGRRNSEMEIIKTMEEKRKAKSKMLYSLTSVNRLDTEEVEVKQLLQVSSAMISSPVSLSWIIATVLIIHQFYC